MADIVLTASEVAQHRRRNVETIDRRVQWEGWPTAKIGGPWRVVETDVLRWVYARTTAERTDATIEAPRHSVKHGML